MKYSILLPYFDRLTQTLATLRSFEHWYAGRDDVEILFIEDCKNFDSFAFELERYKSSSSLNIVYFREETVTRHYTACHLYNKGFKHASGEYIVISCPECFHAVDILSKCDAVLANQPDSYIVCSCMMSNFAQFDESGQLEYHKGQWLQHSKRQNRMLNYCTVIHKDDYSKLGGFDEELSAGYAFGDNDFRDKVVAADLPIVCRDDMLTLHLSHPRGANYLTAQHIETLNKRNEEIYRRRQEERGGHYARLMRRNLHAKRTEDLG